MRSLKMKLSLLVLLAAGLAFVAGAQPNPNPSQQWSELARLEGKDRELVLTWLATDCEASAERRLLDEIAQRGSALAPVFREAFRLGPPPERVAVSRQAAARAYEARQAWLRAEGEQAMSAEEVRRLLEVPAASYSERQLVNADRGWRERALMALGVVGSDDAVAELGRLANDPGADFNAPARRGLEERAARAKPPA